MLDRLVCEKATKFTFYTNQDNNNPN